MMRSTRLPSGKRSLTEHPRISLISYNSVFVPNTTYNFDLWNYGDPVPGDPITLWAKWNGLHQTWRFERGE